MSACLLSTPASSFLTLQPPRFQSLKVWISRADHFTKVVVPSIIDFLSSIPHTVFCKSKNPPLCTSFPVKAAHSASTSPCSCQSRTSRSKSESPRLGAKGPT